MTTMQLENKISLIIEQKFLEYFGGFDVNEKLNSKFVKEIKKRIQDKNKKFVNHSDIIKLYAAD
jgi:hypothetical protein